MKRLVLCGLAGFALAGCASQEPETAQASGDERSPLRLGAGDELGWRLQAHDRAITSVSAEERDLAEHE